MGRGKEHEAMDLHESNRWLTYQQKSLSRPQHPVAVDHLILWSDRPEIRLQLKSEQKCNATSDQDK